MESRSSSLCSIQRRRVVDLPGAVSTEPRKEVTLMRLARNVAVLVLLLAAPIVANRAYSVDFGTTATCGACSCDSGQCCSKSWAGGCECTTCPPPP